jgi:hypothetical protein
METIIVDEHKISVTGITDDDYFSLTDMAKLKILRILFCH